MDQKWRGDPKIGRLVTGGPYAFVRHPLYLGTFLIGAGFCVAVGYPWLGLIAFLGFMVVYDNKMGKEENLLRDECGTEYVVYHAAVPRLIPAFRRYPDRRGQWRWKGLTASKEWKTVIWVTVLVILLYFWEEGKQEHALLLRERLLKHLGLLGLLVVLILMDGIFESVTRRSHRKSAVRPA